MRVCGRVVAKIQREHDKRPRPPSGLSTGDRHTKSQAEPGRKESKGGARYEDQLPGDRKRTGASKMSDLNQPIVIDCGSSSLKAGFAGGTRPKVSPKAMAQAVWPGLPYIPPCMKAHIQNSSPLTLSMFKVTVGTKVGRAKHSRVMPGGALEGEERRITSGRSSAGRVTSYFVGSKLDEHRGAFLLDYPMERGRVVDGGWDAMELLWEVRGFSQHCLDYCISFASLVWTEPF